MSRVHSVSIDVDVDLGDFDDDAIAEEYESRGLGGPGDFKDEVSEMFYAFYFGKTERALELAKQIAQDHTGRILP